MEKSYYFHNLYFLLHKKIVEYYRNINFIEKSKEKKISSKYFLLAVSQKI